MRGVPLSRGKMKAILTYHSIDGSGSVISTSRSTFAEQMRSIVRRGVPVVSLEDLVRSDPTESAVALTFDDGFLNFGEEAWPLLREYGLPATLFVASAYVGGSNRWAELPGIRVPRLPLLSWEALTRLAEEGLTLGAHSVTHPDLTKTDDAGLRNELFEGADEIERRTGQPVAIVAYPYGAVDERVAEQARQRFTYGCTTEFRQLRSNDDQLRLPRIDAYYLRDPRLLLQWGTSRLRAFLHARAGARRVRQALVKWGAL